MRITYAGRCTCSAHALAALLAAASVTAREVSPKDAAPCSATMHHHKSIHHGARKEMRACKSSCSEQLRRRTTIREPGSRIERLISRSASAIWAVAAETVLRLITVRVCPRAHEQKESGRVFALAPAGRVFLAKDFQNNFFERI